MDANKNIFSKTRLKVSRTKAAQLGNIIKSLPNFLNHKRFTPLIAQV